MRTTLNLDDDVLGEVKSYADARKLALGKAVSDILRKGLNSPFQTRVVNGVHMVVLPADSRPVTSEDVKRLLEDEY